MDSAVLNSSTLVRNIYLIMISFQDRRFPIIVFVYQSLRNPLTNFFESKQLKLALREVNAQGKMFFFIYISIINYAIYIYI